MNIALLYVQRAPPSVIPPYSGFSQRIFWIAYHCQSQGIDARLFTIGEKNTIKRFHNVTEYAVKGFRPPKNEKMRTTRCAMTIDHITYPIFGQRLSDLVVNWNNKIFPLIKEFDPDLIDCEHGMRMAKLAHKISKKLKIPLVISSHNFNARIYYTYFRYLKNKYPRFFPSPHFLSNPILQNELKILKLADHIICVSDEDKKSFVDLSIPPEKITVVPNGIPMYLYKASDDVKVAKEDLGLEGDPLIIFVGSSGYVANDLAVQDIINVIAKNTCQVLPKAEFIIIGRGRSPRKIGNITILGEVDEIRPYLNVADIAICPLRVGSGTKLKVLEYFVAGLPVITTSMGIEGIKVDPYNDVILENNIHNFHMHIVKLNGDERIRRKLGERAKAIADMYDWGAITEKYIRVCEKIIENC